MFNPKREAAYVVIDDLVLEGIYNIGNIRQSDKLSRIFEKNRDIRL
ncbi:hypothetical protein [Peribacillus huizhouensis]|uniref:Uncharacterized protein n=1 Tax=Peribacillus huizhouensis TaxID=1501239 RepID=A0ABR6CP28_9BACI|nr:hypothetical protein [Peribacillus huizhouensis]MBA9026325.1 hypothetical protein [Peribacillus huizhouensis]